MNDRTISPTWSEAPADGWKPALTADGIHLWLADLDRPPRSLVRLVATLTADERERAARFRLPEHRDRFVVGRGLLRELLGAYLERPAMALRFACGPRGKPLLAGEDTDADLHFNLSHSGDRALYAIARREVGVDLECLNRVVSDASVAERVCTPREWAAFQVLPAERFREAFFSCWTRKEATAKALGGGLASGLRNLEVCFPDDQLPDGRIGLRDASGREWSVLNLPLDSGWRGALAAEGQDWRWQGWCWTRFPSLSLPFSS